MFCVSMPNLDTSAALVETATKCFATARSSFAATRNHCRAAAAAGAEGHVDDGTALVDVYLLAAEHRIDVHPQAGFGGQPHQQAQRFIGDTVLGIVEVEPDGFQRHPLAARRVTAEQVAQVGP